MNTSVQPNKLTSGWQKCPCILKIYPALKISYIAMGSQPPQPMESSRDSSFAHATSFVYYTQSLHTPQTSSCTAIRLLRPYLKDVGWLMVESEQISATRKVYKYNKVPYYASLHVTLSLVFNGPQHVLKSVWRAYFLFRDCPL